MATFRRKLVCSLVRRVEHALMGMLTAPFVEGKDELDGARVTAFLDRAQECMPEALDLLEASPWPLRYMLTSTDHGDARLNRRHVLNLLDLASVEVPPDLVSDLPNFVTRAPAKSMPTDIEDALRNLRGCTLTVIQERLAYNKSLCQEVLDYLKHQWLCDPQYDVVFWSRVFALDEEKIEKGLADLPTGMQWVDEPKDKPDGDDEEDDDDDDEEEGNKKKGQKGEQKPADKRLRAASDVWKQVRKDEAPVVARAKELARKALEHASNPTTRFELCKTVEKIWGRAAPDVMRTIDRMCQVELETFSMSGLRAACGLPFMETTATPVVSPPSKPRDVVDRRISPHLSPLFQKADRLRKTMRESPRAQKLRALKRGVPMLLARLRLEHDARRRELVCAQRAFDQLQRAS